MYYRINWQAATKRVLLESSASAVPATISGMTSIGSFQHDVPDTLPGHQGVGENHVLFHHVRDALYKIGEQNMQAVAIFVNAPRTLSIGSGTVTVAVNGFSAPLAVTVVPENAEKDVIYTTSDATKATVDSKGVIKGVGAGSAVITGSLRAKPSITATRNVTVTA